jgi:hypothetical protein
VKLYTRSYIQEDKKEDKKEDINYNKKRITVVIFLIYFYVNEVDEICL